MLNLFQHLYIDFTAESLEIKQVPTRTQCFVSRIFISQIAHKPKDNKAYLRKNRLNHRLLYKKFKKTNTIPTHLSLHFLYNYMSTVS
jgi:hypothetical protein